MDGTFGAQAIIERVRVLYRVDTEELDGSLEDSHLISVTSTNASGQRVSRESISAPFAAAVPPSHAATLTCADLRNPAHSVSELR